MEISNNLKKIRNKITASEKKFLRGENSVFLIAVSKTRKINEIISAINENQHHFGENYCQEGVEKIKAVTKHGIVWHFIGPVQSNKTKQIAQYFDWVHTVDRIKIARRLDKMRPENLPPLNVCIQVNTSKEVTKSGISREKSYKLVQKYAKVSFHKNLYLKDLVKKDKLISKQISEKQIDKIFNYSKHFKNINYIFKRVFK